MGLGALGAAIVSRAQTAAPAANVVLGPPGPAGDTTIAIWLFHLAENRSLRQSRRPGEAGYHQEALHLDLQYLVCAGGADAAAAHDALGRIASAFSADPTVLMEEADGAEPAAASVTFTLESLPLADLAALWSSLGPLPLQPAIVLAARGVTP